MEATSASPRSVPSIERTVTLRDGRTVTVRRMRPDDVERSYAFFCALPEEHRKYLRTDVTRRELVERRAIELDPERIERVVVEHDDEIVADGALELQGHGWGSGTAERARSSDARCPNHEPRASSREP